MKISVVFIVLALALGASAHSWLDCINVTNPNTVTNLGNMQCNGYPRGYVGRSNPDANMWKMEGMSPTSNNFYNFPACRNTNRQYSAQFPMLRLRAGEKMTVAYTPNGHTRWHRPPPPNGPRDMWVKWSGVANQDLRTMRDVLNAPSLLQVIFDQPCHSRTTGRELDSSGGICQADVTIPAGTPPGIYQLVWWWPFRFSGAVVEDYTTCWDVEVLAGGGAVTTTGRPATTGPATTGRATTGPNTGSTTGPATTSGGTGTGNGKETVIITRSPSTVAETSLFTIIVGYEAQAPRDIIVDLLDTNNYFSWGRGVVSVPAGKGRTALTIRVQNGPARGNQYIFNAWSIGAGMANVPNVWNQAFDTHSVGFTVGDQLVFTDSC
jgi:hypothetical protein